MTGRSKLRSKFESMRREIKAGVRKQHDLYVNNLIGNVKANPRDFYWYINGKKNRRLWKKRRRNGVDQSELEYVMASSWMCSIKRT